MSPGSRVSFSADVDAGLGCDRAPSDDSSAANGVSQFAIGSFLLDSAFESGGSCSHDRPGDSGSAWLIGAKGAKGPDELVGAFDVHVTGQERRG